MDRISRLPDELLVKIISYIPTKDAVSTSALSKRWERLWMWVPKLECDCLESTHWDFIVKNLPLRAPITESLCIEFSESFHHEDFKLWVGVAASRCLRELSITYCFYSCTDEPYVLLPTNLYTCVSLVTLKLKGEILVDVPEKVCLPSLKTLELHHVTYLNEDSLRLLLSYCPVLKDLVIEIPAFYDTKPLVVIVPSLQRLSLEIKADLSDGSVVVTPFLKYLKIQDKTEVPFSSIEYMPELEEAEINVQSYCDKLLKPIRNVKKLSLEVRYNSHNGPEYRDDIVFSRLRELKIYIHSDYWSKLVVYFLTSSPNLRVLKLYIDESLADFEDYERVNWANELIYVPQCLSGSLYAFEFVGYAGREEERDFLSFLFGEARCLESISFTECET